MTDERMIVKNGKALRLGYTTGSCAAAAAVAAARMYFSRTEADSVSILMPGGSRVVFAIQAPILRESFSSCSVIKDAGDDPDATDGIVITAVCERTIEGIEIAGGTGIGVVTSPGLACSVGEPAINPVPKRMIKENVEKVMEEHRCTHGLKITLSALNGEEIARRTFNPRLGIEGGISILGTTGIVEPMSEKALIDTIKILIDRQKLADPEEILISIGNYGKDYCRDVLGFDIDKSVKISNFIGEALDYIRYKGFKRVVFVGHIGKLIKVAGGIMNTHSNTADCRMEILCSHAACLGVPMRTLISIMEAKTTEAAIALLDGECLRHQVLKSIMDKILFHLEYRTKSELNFNVIMFSSELTVRGDFIAAR